MAQTAPMSAVSPPAGGADAAWTIRPAEPGDAGEIGEVLVAAGVAAWGDFLGAQRIRDANRGRVHPADLVAVDARGVAAFVAWDGATGEIVRLYTHPRAWGRGAGGALLGRAVEALRDAGRRQAWLHTEARNVDARRFYERRGWREQGAARVRTWHGAPLVERRYVLDL